MSRFNIKRFGRKAFKGLKKGASIVRKGASTAKSILGTVDKLSGGMLTSAMASDPRGRALLTGINVVGK